MTPPNRALAIVLALLATAGLATAAFTHSWLIDAHGTSHFGLRDNRVCDPDGDCASSTNKELEKQMIEAGFADDHASHAFAPCGWVTFATSLLAAVALLVAAIIALAGWRPQLAVAPTTISLLAIFAALIVGCVFVATKPGEAGHLGVGLSFGAFGAGCVLGIGGSILLAKVNRPPDPDLTEGAMDPDQF